MVPVVCSPPHPSPVCRSALTVSDFLRHSKPQAVVHPQHTAGNAGSVGSTSGPSQNKHGGRKGAILLDGPLNALNLRSCKPNTPTSIHLIFRPKNALTWGLVLCSLSQKHLRAPSPNNCKCLQALPDFPGQENHPSAQNSGCCKLAVTFYFIFLYLLWC